MPDSIRDRYNDVVTRLSTAARLAGRSAEEIKLLVVTKGQPADKMVQAYQAGARLFGENYPEETAEKLDGLSGCDGLEIHMIGHLQSRKARIVAASFHYMHSIDRVSIAEKLNRELAETGRNIHVLLEVNVSGEESKQGFSALDRDSWCNILPEVEQIASFKNLTLRGLMTMPPLSVEPNAVRPYFQKLCEFRDYLAVQFPNQCWSELSMGTSGDFESAVEEGATFIRVGTAIMGPRPPKNE